MSTKQADDQMYAYKCPVCGMGTMQKLKNDTYQCVSCGEVVSKSKLQPSKGTPEEEFNKWKSTVETPKKKAFEGDTKWQSQKEVVPIGMGERGWQGYEPYKHGSVEGTEEAMAMYWDTVRDLFFDKGNRWSTVLKQLKNMYSEITQDQIEELERHIRYYLDQYKVQVESKKQGISLHDAIEFFIEHQDIIGIPGNIDSKTHTVEFSSGKKLSYDDVVKLYTEHLQKTSDILPKSKYDGFWGSPPERDLGRDPSGNFPSVSWLPKGNEDLDVNEDVRTASKKEAASRGDATAWVRTWVESDEMEGDPKVQEILKQNLGVSESSKAIAERVKELIQEKGYSTYEVQNIESPTITIDWNEIEQFIHAWAERDWERKTDEEWRMLHKQLDTETDPEKRKQIEQRITELEAMEYTGSKRENLKIESSNGKGKFVERYRDWVITKRWDNKYMAYISDLKPEIFGLTLFSVRSQIDKFLDEAIKRNVPKEAEIEINEEAMKKAIEEYIPTLPEKVWIETYGDHEAERYVDNFAAVMREHGRRVPMDMSDVLENHFENLTVTDWVDMYYADMKDHLIDEFYMTKSLEDLEKYYPGLIGLYNKHLQTKTALQNPLTNEQQNQVAAKYGTPYNTALMYYAEAIKNGHAKDRSLEYAISEMKKMNTVIDSAKLVEAIDVYIGK